MGKKARIPTQKAVMAKKALLMKGNSQRSKKQCTTGSKVDESGSKAMVSGMKFRESTSMEQQRTRSVDLDLAALKSKDIVAEEMSIENVQLQFNETVPYVKEAAKQQQNQAMAIRNKVDETSNDGSHQKLSSSKKSWAKEVEQENGPKEKTKSIWDEFDIAKLSNAGCKLEYVTPSKQGGNQIMEIEFQDIRSEINYQGNIVESNELGAHPSFQVIQGYIQRLGGTLGQIKCLC